MVHKVHSLGQHAPRMHSEICELWSHSWNNLLLPSLLLSPFSASPAQICLDIGCVSGLGPCLCPLALLMYVWTLIQVPASLPAQPGLHSASWNSQPHPVSCPLAGSGLPPHWESSYTSSGFFLTNFPRKLLNTSESTVCVFHSPFHSPQPNKLQ